MSVRLSVMPHSFDLGKLLGPSQKRKLKSLARRVKLAYVRRFFIYDSVRLKQALIDVGVRQGDVIFVHSSYFPDNGFADSPARAVATIVESVGPTGTILMASSAYNTSTEDYVSGTPIFDVQNTASKLGILTEIFRRREGTLRSSNPAHPVLGCGPLAQWFIEGHENCAYSCGPGSPFEKLLEKDAKALFFDAELTHLMFFHYLEHTVKDLLPFPLYSAASTVRVRQSKNNERLVAVYPFSKEARSRRRFANLEAELRRRRMVRETKVGNTRLMLINIRDSLRATQDLTARGKYFYEISP